MVHGKVGLVELVLEILVKGAEDRALHHALVDNGARGERRKVRLAERHAAALLEKIRLRRAARLVKKLLELIAARRRMVNEGLTNVGKGLERELAKDVLVLEEARRCTGREGDGRRRMVSW